MNTNRFRFALASVTLLLLLGSLVLSGPALAAFGGRNGRLAWAVLNAGGGGGGGFASLTSYPADLSGHGMQIGYCSEDGSGNVCGAWQNITYSPDGKHLLWNQPGASGTEVVTMANSDASNPQTIVSDSFDDSQASFSHSGREIVYVRQVMYVGGPGGTLVLRNLSDGYTTLVNPRIGGAEPLFSRGDKTILFVRPDAFGDSGGLWSIRPDGRQLRRLVAHLSVFDISPNGRAIAYVTSDGRVFIARANGRYARQIARMPTGDLPTSAVCFSPDGRRLAFTASASSGPGLYVIPASGGKPRLIFDSGDSRNVTAGLSWQPRHP